MKQFKFPQFATIINNGEVKSYIVERYEYIDGELYLLSGTDNIKHHISTVKQKEYFLNKIESLINNK